MYVKIDDDGQIEQYPYTTDMLRLDNPNVSFPKSMSNELLASYGVYPVVVLDSPVYSEDSQKAIQDNEPTLNGDSWELCWTVVNKTAEEEQQYDSIMSTEVRATRDRLLAETDWYGLSDVTMPAEIATYRQALRDVPAQDGFPHNVVWPTKPE
jgi:hypothetical protein